MQRHRAGAYVWAQLLYCLAAVLLAGIVNQPTAYEGDSYLLPSVAAVVLGGTSLLGGRGNLVATAIAALFLTQLDQFVLALGVSLRHAHARPGGGARHRRRALHHRLAEASTRRCPGRVASHGLDPPAQPSHGQHVQDVDRIHRDEREATI